jgi:hypothetical protein
MKNLVEEKQQKIEEKLTWNRPCGTCTIMGDPRKFRIPLGGLLDRPDNLS